nr:MAG TPA: hypothetical protein [Caudoviricetes sp.]
MNRKGVGHMTRLVNEGGHIFRETDDESAVAEYLRQGYTIIEPEDEQPEGVPEFVIENEEGA